MTGRIMHFSFRPVQSFIAQSRRPRDLWASSFLLSYLSGQAMAEIISHGGEILYPVVGREGKGSDKTSVSGDLLTAILRHKKGQPVLTQPYIGSLPNRFKAVIPDHFEPNQCVQAVQDAWWVIAEAVWEKVVKPVAAYGSDSRRIWERQVRTHWDMTWVIGEEASLLSRRKQWRTHVHTVEGGEKCTLVPNLQEISGYFRGPDQVRFWNEFRQHLDSIYELGEFERLSAIGIIKRFYPKVANKEVIGWSFPPEAIELPSVAYLAAIPWMRQTIQRHQKWVETAHPDEQALTKAVAEFADKAKQAGLPTVKNGMDLLASFAPLPKELQPWRELIHLDGTCLYASSLAKILEDRKVPQALSEKTTAAHSALIETIGGEPSTYYALLMMDGDRLGQLLSQQNGLGVEQGELISRALALFTHKVEEVVRAKDGLPIYMGGDDVVAILPLAQALACADELRKAYLDSFKQVAGDEVESTISAAIVYAHYLSPLQTVLQHGRELLDRVAKEETGRDSLALSVWNRSDEELRWSAPWRFLHEWADQAQTQTVLQELNNPPTLMYTTSFLRKMQRLYETAPKFAADKKENKKVLHKLVLEDYLRNEATKEEKKLDERKAVEKKIETLLDLCHPSWLDEAGYHRAEGEFRADGALLLLFLHKEGVMEQ
jgi:CRISPR-associated protein Cmr2